MLLRMYVFFLFIPAFMHPLHMSVTNVQMAEDKLSVSVRIFKDDLALDLLQLKGVSLVWQDEDDWHRNKTQVFAHVYAHLIVGNSDSGRSSEKLEVGKEAITISWTQMNDIQESFSISNSLLVNTFPDQKNLLVISAGPNEKGFEFTKERKSVTLSLNKLLDE